MGTTNEQRDGNETDKDLQLELRGTLSHAQTGQS